ncbi:MAG: Tim44 domain-containing protein, partial [Oceanospirillaceae bacterium]|nr:Tim44 domain-containing protein [Oceanospirillaceae bacterium]
QLNTEVVSVEAQLVGFKEASGFVVAAIAFSGKIKEDSALVAKEFDETWQLTRDMSVDNADWVIAGIEQNS